MAIGPPIWIIDDFEALVFGISIHTTFFTFEVRLVISGCRFFWPSNLRKPLVNKPMLSVSPTINPVSNETRTIGSDTMLNNGEQRL
uniref:Uncharacterized protein n=1 Tax=Tanacetum cinerariifolium TaxID=118510 RepID=A0A699QNI2_TANCI|nr:hypothetical protein [Tanacetum cinerariifolium]